MNTLFPRTKEALTTTMARVLEGPDLNKFRAELQLCEEVRTMLNGVTGTLDKVEFEKVVASMFSGVVSIDGGRAIPEISSGFAQDLAEIVFGNNGTHEVVASAPAQMQTLTVAAAAADQIERAPIVYNIDIERKITEILTRVLAEVAGMDAFNWLAVEAIKDLPKDAQTVAQWDLFDRLAEQLPGLPECTTANDLMDSADIRSGVRAAFMNTFPSISPGSIDAFFAHVAPNLRKKRTRPARVLA